MTSKSSQPRSRLGMTCNIDRRGKRVRGAAGVVCALIGAALAAWALLGAGLWVWVGAAAFVAAGAFSLFEAANGWCAVRAIGWKTKV